MVFPGGRSRGCFLCRQRKVKCDEARPACRRCAIYGKHCPGYPDSYAFRVQLQKTPKAPKATKATIEPQRQHQSVITTPKDSPSQALGLSTIRLSPTSGQDQALCFFVNQYRISAGSDGAVGFLDFLSDLLHSNSNTNDLMGETKDCLQFTLDAVAKLAFFRRLGAKRLYVDARKSYGRALEAINAALRLQTEAYSDRTISRGERQGPVNQQTAGICYLMQLRGSQNLSSNCSLSLFSWGLCHAITQFLITGEYQYAGLADLLNLAPESSHWHRAVRVSGKIALFMSITKPLVETPNAPLGPTANPAPAQVQSLFDFALDILDEVGNWYRTLPESWTHSSFQKLPSACAIDDNIFEINPKGSWASGYMGQFYSTEILFYIRMGEVAKLITGSPALWMLLLSSSSEHQRLIEKVAWFPARIEYLLSKLCALVHSPLRGIPNKKEQRPSLGQEEELLVNGRVGEAYMLLGPLWLVSNCPFASPEQVKVCREALEHIGGKMGLRLAMSLIPAT